MKLDANAPADVRERVSYDSDTGIFKALRSAGKRRKGDVCGYPDRLGYVKLSFDGKWVLAHRLAWFFIFRQWPDGEIDHIDGDPSNNRISNLRVCTRSQNVMNTRRGNGVCWHKTKKKWQALVKSGGKSHFAGHFDTREEAEEAAIACRKKLHGEFVNIAPPPAPTQEGFDL